MKINLVDILQRNIPVCITKRCVINFIVVFVARSGVSLVIRLPLLYQGMLVQSATINLAALTKKALSSLGYER